MADYFPFDPAPRRPRQPPPAGACDAQFHLFGPPERYPPRPNAAYTMPSATLDALRHLHATLGFARGLIVQPTTYGTDHRALLDGLAALGPGYRGCVIAAALDEAGDAELARLHEAGVRAIRFNFPKQLNLAPAPDQVARRLARLRELGWFAKVQPAAEGIAEHAGLFRDAPVPVVIDHMGRADAAAGIDGPNARAVRDLLAAGAWVMLSNGHKLSRGGPPWDDVRPIARAFIEAAPDRVIWASDWPHPLSTKPPPNDADLLALLDGFTADAAERHRILVENPARLLGLGA